MTARRRQPPAPRWQTPLPQGTVGSWGPEVAWYARRELGLTLDRWQERALNRALAVDADDRLVHRHYLISTARQQGKTVGVRSVLGWFLTAGELPGTWSRAMGLAYDRAQARIPYEAVMVDLEPIRRRYPRGGLRLTRYLGLRSDLYGRHREYHVGSKESRNAIRGTSNDLAVFDEVRTQTGYETWAALEPTTRARPEGLILGISTAGDDRSQLLRDWWERGIRVIAGAEPAAGFGMTWYAAPDDADPYSREAILAANPAVAEGRVPFDVVRDSRYSLTTSAYRQETLNLWSEGGDEWLPPGAWRQATADQPASAMRVILGAEAVPSWRRATVTVALVTDAGAWVGVAGELDSSRTDRSTVSPAELVALVDQLAAVWKPSGIAYSAAASAAPHLRAWADASPRVSRIELGARQIRSASQLFRSELIGGRLTHGADPLLAQQVRAARPAGAIEGSDWYLSIRDSVGEVDGIRAAAWATWAAISPEADEPRPALYV